jgi:putative heme-binding domain-containing protein
LRLVPRLDKLDTTGLVAALDSPNGWQRDTAQRLLVQSHDHGAIAPLEALVKNCPRAKTRLQALCTLDGLAALSPETLSIPLADAEPAIRARAICLAEPLYSNSPELRSAILAEVNDPNIRVRYQLAFSLGEWHTPEAGRALARLAMRDAAQPDMETAILSSSIAHLDTMLDAIFADAKSPAPDHLVEQLVSFAASENNQPALVRPLQAVAASSSGFSSQQISIAAGLLDGLARRQTSLKLFQSDASPALRPALDAFAAAIPGMIAIVGDSNVDQSRRELAARLLGRDVAPLDDELKQLRKLLEPQTPMPLQEAAIGVLKRLQQPEVADVLLSGWKGYAPGQRTQVLALLLSRLEWTRALLNALKDGTVSPAEIGAVERQKLRSNSDSGVRERAAGLFTAGNPDRAKVVKDYQLALSLNGDAARGAVLFRANCVPCHRLNGEGFSVGPDLATVTSKPASELLTSILDPSRAIEANYTAYTAVTRDGRELTGIIGDETPNSITLRMPGGIQETILRSDLTRLTASKLSLMPEGFEIALKPQDIADLIAFITSSPRAEK